MSENKSEKKEKRERNNEEKMIIILAATIPWFIFVLVFMMFPVIQTAKSFGTGVLFAFLGSAFLVDTVS